jgi:uncharacterized protein (TIGR03085 family)
MTVTTDERHAMCDLLEELGPDQPTLCGTWTTRDLLAHLLVRERRPDAALGIVVPALAKHTERAMAHEAARPFADMVAEFRHGPPLWALPWAIPVIGDRANLFEFFVHHEDIRRAQADWSPRAEDARRDDALWGALRLMGRVLFRTSPVGVTLRAAGREDLVAHKGPNGVIVVGLPSEITLVGFGRPTGMARIVLQGDTDDVAEFEASARGV